MNNVNHKLQHQVDVIKSQKNISLQGPLLEVNSFVQALSSIYELAAEVDKMERKLDTIKRATLGVSAKNAEDAFNTIICILEE